MFFSTKRLAENKVAYSRLCLVNFFLPIIISLSLAGPYHIRKKAGRGRRPRANFIISPRVHFYPCDTESTSLGEQQSEERSLHYASSVSLFGYYGLELLVKFPHSPILHYAFSSWIEKTMTKTIDWENRFFLQ